MKNRSKPVSVQIEILEHCIAKFGDYGQGKRARKLEALKGERK